MTGFRRSALRFVVAAVLSCPAAVQAASLTWTGATNGAWDTTTANWAGESTTFATGDAVTFDDTGSTGGITVSGSVVPLSTLVANGTLAYTINGNVAGSGGLTKSGTGTLTMQGVSTFGGGTVVDGGTLVLGGGGGAAGNVRGSVTINSGGTVRANSLSSWGFGFGTASQAVSSVTIDGGTLDFGGVIFNSGGWSAATATLTAGTISGVTFDWFNGQTNSPTLVTQAAATSSVISSGLNLRLNGGTLTVDVADGGAADDLVISGPILGGGPFSPGQANGLTKTGPGVLVLSNSSNYTGATMISNGTLRLGTGGSTGSLSTSSVITTNGAFVINRSGTVTQGIDFSGTAVGGTGSLTQAGPGTLVLSATNTYSGGTVVDGGTLVLGPGADVGVIRGAVTVNAGATLQASRAWSFGYGNSSQAVTGVTVNGGGIVFSGGTADEGWAAATVTLSGGTISGDTFAWYQGQTTTPTLATLANAASSVISSGIRLRLGSSGALTFDVADGAATQDLVVSGPINYTGFDGFGSGIRKTGAGTLLLSGTNTYTGPTRVDAGTLVAGNAGALGDQSSAISVQGGTLDLGGFGVARTGTVSISGGTIQSGTITNNAAGFAIQGGTVSAVLGGSVGLVKSGAGTATLTAANTFTGGTVVDSGTLVLTAGGQNAGRVRGSLTINPGATVQADTQWALGWSLSDNGTTVDTIAVTGGQLEFTGTANVGGMQASTMTLTGGTVSGQNFHWFNGITSTPSLVTQASAVSSVVSSGFRLRLSGSSLNLNVADGAAADDLVISGVIWDMAPSSVSGIAKTGAGLARLTGANAYAGDTDVYAGTLAVDGSLGNSGTLLLHGGTLSGTGTIGQGTLASGGGIAPGNSPGTLSFTNGLTITDPSVALNFELSPTNYSAGGGINDLIAVTGGLALDGMLNVTAIGGGDFSAVPTYTSWRLFAYSGSFTNDGLSLGSLPSLGAGRSYEIDTSTFGQVNLVVVPEPGALGVAGLGMALMAGMTRWRRRRP